MICGSSSSLTIDCRDKFPAVTGAQMRLLHSNGHPMSGGVPCTGTWSYSFRDAWTMSVDDALALQTILRDKPDGLPMTIHYIENIENPPQDIYCAGPGALISLEVLRSPEGMPIVKGEIRGSNGLTVDKVINLQLSEVTAQLVVLKALLTSSRQRREAAPEGIEQLAEKIEFVENFLQATPQPTPEQIRKLLERLA